MPKPSSNYFDPLLISCWSGFFWLEQTLHRTWEQELKYEAVNLQTLARVLCEDSEEIEKTFSPKQWGYSAREAYSFLKSFSEWPSGHTPTPSMILWCLWLNAASSEPSLRKATPWLRPLFLLQSLKASLYTQPQNMARWIQALEMISLAKAQWKKFSPFKETASPLTQKEGLAA